MPEPGWVKLFHLNERVREAFPSNGWWLVQGQFCMSHFDWDKTMQENTLHPHLSQMAVSEHKFATHLAISLTLPLMLCEVHQLLHDAQHALD